MKSIFMIPLHKEGMEQFGDIYVYTENGEYDEF